MYGEHKCRIDRQVPNELFDGNIFLTEGEDISALYYTHILTGILNCLLLVQNSFLCTKKTIE